MLRIRVRITILCLVLSVLLVSGMNAIAEDGVTENEIVLGMSTDLSGPLAFMGQGHRDGALLYFRYINENGGVHGRKIKLLVEDDGFQSPRAIQNVKKLITRDKVFALTMNLGSTSILAAAPLLEQYKVLLMPTGSGSITLSQPPRKYLFVMDTSFLTCARIAVKWVSQNLKHNNPKIAVIYQEENAGMEWLAGIKEGVAKYYGTKDILELPFKRGAIDFSSQIGRCKKEGATHVYLHANIREPAFILKEAMRIQYKATFIANASSSSPKVVELMGSEALDFSDGFYISTYGKDAVNDTDPGILLFKKIAHQYKASDELIRNGVSAWSFNAAWVVTEVLKRTGRNLTRENFIKAAETLNKFDTTMMSPITWTSTKRSGGDASRILKADSKRGGWIHLTEWIYDN